jgi:predicted acylesterase/phospholipase RssA/CRP-like cAMP-binding protein
MAPSADLVLDPSVAVLRRSRLCQGLTAAELQLIAAALRLVPVGSGQVIWRSGDPSDRMCFVARGRIRRTLEQPSGRYTLQDYLDRGDHFGEMGLLTTSRRLSTISAVTDGELLELNREAFEQLLTSMPGFAANLSRALGFRLQSHAAPLPRRRKPKTVALVGGGERGEALATLIAAALAKRGQRVCLLIDRDWVWHAAGGFQGAWLPGADDASCSAAGTSSRRPAAGDGLPPEENRAAVPAASSGSAPPSDASASAAQRPSSQGSPAGTAAQRPATQGRLEMLHKAADHHDRVLVLLGHDTPAGELAVVLRQCEDIWWLADSKAHEEALAPLRRVAATSPDLMPRIHLVWLVRKQEQALPSTPWDLNLARRDFRIVLNRDPSIPCREQELGISRLLRHLQGTAVGLALSGGGARGLAHLGVLRALDRAGIFCDLLAGTSSGALMGLPYAYGYDPAEAVDHFKAALTPPRWMRAFPGGDRWYVWRMFRSGGWDGKLRPYFGYTPLEHMLVPFYTVAVDLISGEQVIRERGDAVHAVLESINFPPIGRPILRDGMALVDGGLLNNLPADVLPPRGADLVIGVDVVSKLDRSFAGNTLGTPAHRMKRPGMIETLWRANEVQEYGLADLRSDALDVVILPDTSRFGFFDFGKAHELADIGEAAAEEALPQIRQMLAEMEGE